MEESLNKLLIRQIKRHFGSVENIPKNLEGILADINNTYKSFEEDTLLLQNSIEISSQELRTAFLKHKKDAETQKKTITKINEAIQAINPYSPNEVAEGNTNSFDNTAMFNSLIKLIEEGKHTEEENRKLSIAVEQNPASVVITDVKGNIEYVNPKFCHLTGYSKEEAVGKNPRILKSENSKAEDSKELWDTILAGNVWQGEFQNKKKNGDLYWELATISAVKNSNGEIINFLAIKEDITERKMVEETLQNERSLFRTIIDLIPDAIYVKDINGRKIIANPKEVEIAGLESEDEIIGKTDSDLYSSEQALQSNSEDQFVLQTGKPMLNYEGTITDKLGKVHYLLGSKVPLFDINGKIIGLVGVSHDITDRKNAEDELKVAHKSLSDVLQAAIHTSIISTDANGIITVFSKGAEKMLGYSADELIGRQTPSIFHLESELDTRSKELSAELGRKIEGFEVFVAKAKMQDHEERTWIYIHKNGNSIYVRLVITVIRDQNNEIVGFLGIANDITKSKEAEDALLVSSQKWEAIISSSPDGIGMVSLDGKLTFMSEKLARMYGYSVNQQDEYIGEPIFKFIDPSNHQVLSENFQKLLNGEDEYKITEYLAVRKDNSRFYVDVNSTILLDANGKAANILFIERDITERRQVEAELEESREKYRGLSEASFEAIFISEKGVCIEQNQAAEMMFGYTTEEAMTRYGTDWIIPEDREMVMKNMISGMEDPYEATALRKDGTTFPCVLHGRMMHYKGRDVRVTSLADVSLLKKVENELIRAKEIAEESEQKFRSIIQSQAEGIGFVNKNEIFEFANTASERIFETDENELVGTCLYDFLEPEEIEKVNQQTNKRGEGYVNTYELQIITKKGNPKFIHITATPKMDSNNNYLGAYGVFQDITDRKKAEEEVIRVSSRLAMATLAGGIGVWELDILNNLILADDQMYRLFGIEKQNSDHHFESWLRYIHPDDKERINLEIKQAINEEKDFNTEFRVNWSDSSTHNMRALAIIQQDDSGNPVRMIGTIWDISDQKKTESILLRARQEAEMANKAKSIFLANMSHEIRTPLNAIIGFSQLMSRDKHLSELQLEYNYSIIRAGEHLLSLINDILELSKMEAGRLELNPVNIDIYALFADIQMMFSEPSKTKHLQFIFEMSRDFPQFVMVDDNKLRRIFINLIGNAIKFTDEGGIAIRVRIDRKSDANYFLVAEVQDSGPGISEEETEMLFKQFMQTSTGIKNSSGTGLGLALSRELAILMGGDIKVKSEVGKGSVFTFWVEVKLGNSESILRLSRKRVIGINKVLDEYRILVVDDKVENLQVVVKLLQLVGFETKEAMNGEEAIVQFEHWNPHLILMDMRMPVMDGYEAAKIIKSTKKGKNVPIIALTASSFEDERRKTQALGMQGHIRKPFRESELFETIGNILGISYEYEKDLNLETEKNYADLDLTAEDVSKLPIELISKMKEAVSVADLDLLLELIKGIDMEYAAIKKQLETSANNFDYPYLNKILSK